MTMVPLLFGSPKTKKYAVFQPAIGTGSKGRAVVICNSLFDEAICAHRTIRFTADSLARARWNSLRFDYFGTGDSYGEEEEFRISQALIDVDEAIDELKANTGLQRVYLMGIRFGGTLAILAAIRRHDVRGLILWDPVVDGFDLLAKYKIDGRLNEAGLQSRGFLIPKHALDEIDRIKLVENCGRFAGRVLLIVTSQTSKQRDLASALQDVDYLEVDAPEAWSNTPLGGVRPIPNEVVDKIKTWKG